MPQPSPPSAKEAVGSDVINRRIINRLAIERQRDKTPLQPRAGFAAVILHLQPFGAPAIRRCLSQRHHAPIRLGLFTG